jgi:hypothetical protein
MRFLRPWISLDDVSSSHAHHVDLVSTRIRMTTDITDMSVRSDTISHGVFQLREWGTERRHALPSHALRCRLGSGDGCAVHLDDARVLPLHAQLTRERQRWLIRALGDAAALWRDGARSDAFSLEPGVEIGVGKTTLIAEDARWTALRAFCARLLGWDRERRVVVDRALRSIRMSLTQRAPLVLRGDGDMVPIAHALHRRVLGPDRPFVVCDPRRHDQAATVRSPRSCGTVAAALKAAAGGSVCVRLKRLPRGFPALLARVSEPGAGVQLILCEGRVSTTFLFSTPMDVPPLATRTQDLPRIIDEYALDALDALGAPVASFQREDHRWILEHASTSLFDIEKATLRRVALRSSANMTRAAARLGMAPVSLFRWLGRRE